jgi:uncharacterized protein
MWRPWVLLFLMLSFRVEAQNSSSLASPNVTNAPAPPEISSPSIPTIRTIHPELGAAFRTACWQGNLSKVQELFAQGAPLEDRDVYGRTPLFLACHGDPDVVKFLMAQGAKIDAAEKDGDMSMTHACQYGDLESAKMLLAAGANPNVLNDTGQTPLMLAAIEGHDDLVAFLIDQHVDVNFENSCDPALFGAVWKDHPSTAKLLIEAGARLTRSADMASSKKGCIPILSTAAQTNDNDLVDLLLAHGADINSPSQRGETTLMRAVQGAMPAMIEHLLEKGADPNLQDDEGQTALMRAVNYQQPAGLKILIDHGAKMEIKDKKGRTALMWACYYIYDPNIQFLIDHGADINASDPQDETPLTYAGDRGDTAIVQLLINQGVFRTGVHIIAKESPVTSLPAAHAWALAEAAIYVQSNASNPHVLGFADQRPAEQIKRDMKEEWSITDKASFLEAINNLQKSGQRISYQQDGFALSILSDQQFADKLVALSPDQQVQVRIARDNYIKWKDKFGLAWDLCRAANLINFGFAANYINEGEA